MIHRYWCGRCRNVTTAHSDVVANPPPTRTCEKCSGMASFLESVPDPVEISDDTSDPTAAKPRKPPSREAWYAAGYAPGTYEARFAGPEWLPCWSDPNFKQESKDNDETEQAPDVDDS